MDDRSKAKLRGPVRTRSSANRGESYLPDGRLSKTWYRNPDDSEGRTEYTYNSTGQPERLAYWHDGKPGVTTDYQYDAQARCSSIFRSMPNASEFLQESFSYDAEGNQTSIRYTPD